MKIRATTNQLGLAPMRIPKTRASWIDRVPIHAHGGRRPQARALRADSRDMRPPSPRSMPRLGGLRAAADDPRSMSVIDTAVKRFESEDAKLFATVKRGDRAGATELVSGTVDEAADGVTSAIGAYIERTNHERAAADDRFAA